MEVITIDEDSLDLHDDGFREALFTPRPATTLVFRTSRVVRKLTVSIIAVGSFFTLPIYLEFAAEQPLFLLGLPSMAVVHTAAFIVGHSSISVNRDGVVYKAGFIAVDMPWADLTAVLVQGSRLTFIRRRSGSRQRSSTNQPGRRFHPEFPVSGAVQAHLKTPEGVMLTYPRLIDAVIRSWWPNDSELEGTAELEGSDGE